MRNKVLTIFSTFIIIILVVITGCNNTNSKQDFQNELDKTPMEVKDEIEAKNKLKGLLMAMNDEIPKLEVKELEAGKYPAGSPVANNGKLKIIKGKLVNENGDYIQLKGLSTFGLQWVGDYITDQNIEYFVTEWGINLLRIAMYTDEGGYIGNPSLAVKLAEIVDICEKYGIYTIVDWHILSDGDPNEYIEESKEFFADVAKMYKNKKHVLYEICNEPNGDNVTWKTHIKPYAEVIIPEIRKYDKDGIIIVGTGTWSQDVDDAAQNPLKYENIMYTLHFYAGTHKQWLRDRADKALKKGLAIFVTEWGTSEATGDGGVFKEEARKWLDWMDENKISWANWSITLKNESSALLKSTVTRSQVITDNDLTESGKFIKEELIKRIN